ncbi:TerD family protein [Bacillus spongiae]|uniref:TerD family protein n=1 Tax=Bacillus spongiae TaxID=2683610 RepID=A0ABU8HFC6_9BACI
MKNSIYLTRKLKVFIENGEGKLSDVYLSTALKNIEGLGFTFSKPLIERAKTLSNEAFTTFYTNLVKNLKEQVGANVNHVPMYPNFPQDVMEMTDAELYINAIIHYVTLLLPNDKAKERFPLLDRVDLKVIDLGSEEDFYLMLSQLIGANTSISLTDKKDIEWAIHTIDDISKILPKFIPHKENLAFTIQQLLKHDKASMNEVSHYFNNATDVLRLAVALSDGDISLATPTKFKKFNRPERRFLLGLLDESRNITEDMIRYKKRWIRLGEILHPGEYRKKFPNAYRAFQVLRNSEKVETFNSKVEAALGEGQINKAVNLLSTRPGEFARRLDHLLRLSEKKHLDSHDVISAFSEVKDDLSTPVLLQLASHFRHRNEERDIRTFFPKGNVAKAWGIENNLPRINNEVCSIVKNLCEEAMRIRFSELPPLGKGYLDERLRDYLVPFSQRSASKSLRTLVRGSKISLPEGNFIRFFLWWKEGRVGEEHTGRVDIDLSAVIYDEGWEYQSHISYTNLRQGHYAFHSGDITSAPNGASEFIDFDIPKVLENGGRYVVMSLHSFTDHPYKNLPECFAGWMVRQSPNSGEIFEPATVQDKVDVTSDSTISIPVVLDLLERKLYWTDLSLTRYLNEYNNIEANKGGLALVAKSMTSIVKPNLYDLFKLHLEARGELVENIEEAESIFSLQNGITPFDIEKIMAEFIS